MGSPVEVELAALAAQRLRPILSLAGWTRFSGALDVARAGLRGRTVWMVSSTATGGGVAELLRTFVPYWLGAGVAVRWVVITAPPRFFRLTKRLHNMLHGHPGDGGALAARERDLYEASLAPNADWLIRRITADDIVVLHDPQTVGLAPGVKATGASVICRSHVGADHPSALVDAAVAFLRPYSAAAHARVFTRRVNVPPRLGAQRVFVIPPCIDPCATKNRAMDETTSHAILERAGLMKPPDARIPVVAHLARWDRLKDPIGVMEAFAAHVLDRVDARLVLAGPPVDGVPDDPEQAEVYADVERRWKLLPAGAQRRIALAEVPMADLDENAAIVNAIQRQATVIVKKSLEEGFGLGVTEGMWKGQAVVATRVGGHRDQIEHGVSGLLVDDPYDLAEFGGAVVGLLLDPARRKRLGEAAHRRVAEQFLPDRYIARWSEVLSSFT